MKKIAAFAITITVLSLSITALADATATDSGKTTATTTVTGAGSYSTVLITDCSDDNNIVYVDQADTIFDAQVDFLLKANPNYGKYNVKLGGENVDPTSTYFYVGVDADPQKDDVPMKRLSYTGTSTENNTTYYTAGFYKTVEADELKDYKSLKVGYNNGTQTVWGGFDLTKNWSYLPEISGDGDLVLIFELDQIEANEIDSVLAFLSHDVVGTENGYK